MCVCVCVDVTSVGIRKFVESGVTQHLIEVQLVGRMCYLVQGATHEELNTEWVIDNPQHFTRLRTIGVGRGRGDRYQHMVEQSEWETLHIIEYDLMADILLDD